MTMIRVNRKLSMGPPPPFKSESGSTAIYVSKYLSSYPAAEIIIFRRIGSSPGDTVIVLIKAPPSEKAIPFGHYYLLFIILSVAAIIIIKKSRFQ